MVTMQLTDPHVLVSLGLRLLEACLMISRLRQMYVDVFFSYIYIYILAFASKVDHVNSLLAGG